MLTGLNAIHKINRETGREKKKKAGRKCVTWGYGYKVVEGTTYPTFALTNHRPAMSWVVAVCRVTVPSILHGFRDSGLRVFISFVRALKAMSVTNGSCGVKKGWKKMIGGYEGEGNAGTCMQIWRLQWSAGLDCCL